MNFLQSRLDAGGWVNVFPEGKVNWPRENLRLKWGVGRLIADSQADKLFVLPVYHHGMASVLPNPESKGERQPVVPRLGNLVTVCIGQPIDFAPPFLSILILWSLPIAQARDILVSLEYRVKT